MLNENEITELLRDNDRARAMMPAERARVAARLGLSFEQPSKATPDAPSSEPRRQVVATDSPGREPARHVVAIDASVHDKEPNRGRRRRTWAAVAAVAAFLVFAGSAILLQGVGDSDDVATVTSSPTAVPTATAQGAAYCRGAFLDLVDALESWRGLDEWSRLTDSRDPAPHVPDFVVFAIDGLSFVGASGLVEERTQFTEVVAGLPDATSAAVRTQLTTSVSRALSFIDSVIRADLATGSSHFVGCDLGDLFRAAESPG